MADKWVPLDPYANNYDPGYDPEQIPASVLEADLAMIESLGAEPPEGMREELIKAREREAYQRQEKLAVISELVAAKRAEIGPLAFEWDPEKHPTGEGHRFIPTGGDPGSGGKADKPTGPRDETTNLVLGQRTPKRDTFVNPEGATTAGWSVHTASGEAIHLHSDFTDPPEVRAPDISAGHASRVLNAVADLYEQHPRAGGPPDIVVKSLDTYARQLQAERSKGPASGRARDFPMATARMLAGATQAYTDRSRPGVIHVVAENLDKARHGEGDLPATRRADPVQASMTRQYGQVLLNDATSAAGKAGGWAVQEKADALSHAFVGRSDGLTDYGTSNGRAGYSEAYAEWALSRGSTDNVAAHAYAKAFEWPDFKKKTAQAIAKVDKLAEVRSLADQLGLTFEFDPEKHPRDEKGRFGQGDGGGGGAEGERYGYAGVPERFDKMWSEMSHDERRAADPLFRAWDDVTKGGQYIDNPEDRARLHPERYVDRRESFPKGIPGPVLRLGQVETQLRRAADGSAELYDMTPLPLGKTFEDIPKGAKVDMSGGEKGRPLVEVAGSGRPLDYTYRIVSEAEHTQAKERGFFRSDGRMNLGSQEGTVMSASSTGSFYRPHGEVARIVRFNYDKAWKVDPADQYIKAPPGVKIPLSKVDRVTGPIDPNPDDLKRAKLAAVRTLADQLGLAFEWDADKHPKGEGGRFVPAGGGGEATAKEAPVKDPGPKTPTLRPVREVKGKFVEGKAVNAWAVKTQDGKQVLVYQRPFIGIGGVEHGAVHPETVAKLASAVADAYDRDPRPDGPPVVRVLSGSDYYDMLREHEVDEEHAFDLMRTTLAYVHSERPGEITAIRQNIDPPSGGPPKVANPGWFMPAEEALKAGGNPVAGTMAHEYGHLRFHDKTTWSSSPDPDKLVARDRDKANLLLYSPPVREALSQYGKSNYMEAHAEAYAEYHLTNGRTDNVAAQAFAKAFRWRPAKGEAAQLAAIRSLVDELGLTFEWDSEKHPKDERGRWAEIGGGEGGDKPAATTDTAAKPHGDWTTNAEGWAKHTYEMKAPLFSTTVDRVEKTDYGYTHIVGTVRNPDGTKIGEFNRSINPELNRASHTWLTIDPSEEGKGIAAAFNAHAEAAYRRAGIGQIGLVANINVGGYAWAKAGYEWRTPGPTATAMTQRLQDLSGSYREQRQVADAHGSSVSTAPLAPTMVPYIHNASKEDEPVLRRLVAEHHKDLYTPAVAAKVAELAKAGPTASDMVHLGLDQGAVVKAENGQRYWLGKLMLLGSEWEGSKKLDPAGAAASSTTVTFASEQTPAPDPALKARLQAAGAPDYNYPPVDWEDRGDGPIEFWPPSRDTKLAAIAALVERFEWDADKHPKDEKGRWAPSGGGAAEPVSIGALPPGDWEVHPKEWAKAAYEMQGKGFHTVVGDVYTKNYELRLSGSIISELTGGQIGQFERRVFAAANPDGTVDRVVNHEYLQLDRAYEAHHIAAEFNAHAEEAYKAAGITRIDLHANIDVGGYAWARAGYEWDPKSEGARTVGDHVSNLNDQYERWGHHTLPMATGEHFTPNLSALPDRRVIQKAVEEQHDKLFNDEVAAAAAKLAADPNLKARDVAQLGYTQGAVIKAENGQRYWAGKLLLMGQDWYGSKRLGPALTPAEYERKYAHAAAVTVTLAAEPPSPDLKARLKAAGAPDYNYPPVDWEDKGDGPVDFGPEPPTDTRAAKLAEVRELVDEFRKRKRKRPVARVPRVYPPYRLPLYRPLPPPAPTPSPPPAPPPGDGGSPPAPPAGGGGDGGGGGAPAAP